MPDDVDPQQPPSWWLVDRRAAREAGRQARREDRGARRAARKGASDDPPGREPITPERIADAALAVIDAQGVDGLTVRGLAQALGVGTMTLYWYVQNKDEVLGLVADRMLAGVRLPPPGEDWRASVREGATAVRAALLRHGRAVPVIVTRGAFGPNGLDLLEGTLAILRAAGFGAEEAVDAYFTISNFVTGFCVFETAGVGSGAGSGAQDGTSVESARQYLTMLPPDRYPNLVASGPRLFAGSRDERFAYGLECLVAGLAARLATAG